MSSGGKLVPPAPERRCGLALSSELVGQAFLLGFVSLELQSGAGRLRYPFSTEHQSQGDSATGGVLHGWNLPCKTCNLLLQKVSLCFIPQVMFLFSSIVTGEENTVVLARGGGRSRGGWTTLSRSGKIQAGTTLTQILWGLIVTVHQALESEGARSRVTEPSAFLQACSK